MIFKPELAEKVMRGEKTVTRRLMSDNPRSPWYKGGCKLEPGCCYAVQPGRGKPSIGRVRIVSVTRSSAHITEEEARREGFESVAEFDELFFSMHPWLLNVDWRVLWRVEFEVVEVAA